MVVSRRDGRLRLIEQNEHGRLCGDICDHWGNDHFERPARLESARVAAAMHDEGWREADAEPLFNAGQHRPLNFLEIEMSEHVPLYRRGAERVAQLDPYAGLLVSMHWTGLYRGRWGLQGGGVFRSTGTGDAARLQDRAVNEQEQAWIERKRDLMTEEPRSDFETALWHNYELLQAFDLLSLYLCTADLTPAPGAPAERLTDVLGDLEPAPGPRVVGSVPDGPGPRAVGSAPHGPVRRRVDLVLTPADVDTVVLDPYPFDQDEVELALSALTIPDRPYESPEAVRSALEEAEPVALACRFTRPR